MEEEITNESKWICNICGWSGMDDELTNIPENVEEEEEEEWRCPNCGSDDIDDISNNPYDDPDTDLDEGFDSSIRI